jgi:N-acetylmuramidase/Putative peptidoglycan binding domain
MPIPFQGTAWALSSEGLAGVADKLGVFAAEIWALLSVETSGCGYLPDRRPQILYERHIFHRLTHGQYDDSGISDASAGGYGAFGTHQYDRLNLAITKNPSAALKSASWGIGQVMGENFAEAGYSSVETMVAAMSQSEDEQIAAMANFLVSQKLHRFLQAHDWTTFARNYNGQTYAINRYDLRLNAEYQKYSSGLLPDLNVRAAQLYLTYLGFHPGAVDGVPGKHTLSALADFQVRMRVPARNVIDADTVPQLKAALALVSNSTNAG